MASTRSSLTPGSIQSFKGLLLKLEASVSCPALTIRQILRLKPGDRIQLERRPDEDSELWVGGASVAKGRLESSGDRRAFRLTRIHGWKGY